MIFFDSIKIKESTVMGVPKEFEVSGGLTKLELVAAFALCGYLAGCKSEPSPQYAAKTAFTIADELLYQLEKSK